MANAKPLKKSKSQKSTATSKKTIVKSLKSKKRGKISSGVKSKSAKKPVSRAKSKNVFEKALPKNIEKLKSEMLSAIDKFEKNELVQKVEQLLEKFEIYLLVEGGKVAKKSQKLAKKAHKMAKEKLKKKGVKRAKKKTSRKAKS